MKTLLIVLLTVCIVSCGPPPPEPGIGNIKEVVNYGNGVYGFTNDDFPQTLSTFLRVNPNLEVTAISGNGTGAYGKNTYFIVTFKETK